MVGFAENRLEEVSIMFLRNGGINGDESHARKYEVALNFLRIGDLSKSANIQRNASLHLFLLICSLH